MRDDGIIDFGLIITCVLPGCVALWGLGYIYPPLETWITGASMASATVGSFFYVLLAAIAAGLTVSCVRWLVIDALHYWTGLRPPPRNYFMLAQRTEAYHMIIANHYQYYQFYANMVVAITFAYTVWRVSHSLQAHPLGWTELAVVSLIALFFAGSRNTLKRYYRRTAEVLQEEQATPPKLIRPK